ncbi:MAG TPA: hypothetical protein VGW78_07395 [Candidatus Babeliales bacterium]|jgi:hypothetical protein|nr:hypothetical protein [Candidatus Babeliales bacterium]
MKYILFILCVLPINTLTDFSPTIINIKKNIEQLNKERTALDRQWTDQYDRLEEKQRADYIIEELRKKMIEVQAYWPAIKKEIESTCAQLPDSCEGAETSANIPCCANLKRMGIILESIEDYAPNEALFNDVTSSFYTYMMPLAVKKIQKKAIHQGKSISEQEAREQAKKELDARIYVWRYVYELLSENK